MIRKDVRDGGSWQSIRERLESMGDKEYDILIISDDFLKSVDCMYEVTELILEQCYWNRLIPVIVDRSIYDYSYRIKYVVFWQQEYRRLEEQIFKIEEEHSSVSIKKLRKIHNIQMHVSNFLSTIVERNDPNIIDVNQAIERKILHLQRADKGQYGDSLLNGKRKKPVVIALANPAEGTGKSFASAMLSLALAKQEDKKVLCISVQEGDEAQKVLGIWGFNDNIMQMSYGSTYFEIATSPRDVRVDAISSDNLRKIGMNQAIYTGRIDIMAAIGNLSYEGAYEYAVCDCGIGSLNVLEKQILLGADKIVVPVGRHKETIHGLDSICTYLTISGDKKNVYLFHTMGLYTGEQEETASLRREFAELKKKFAGTNVEITELKSVIPDNRYVKGAVNEEKDLFAYSRLTAVCEAYTQAIREMTGPPAEIPGDDRIIRN